MFDKKNPNKVKTDFSVRALSCAVKGKGTCEIEFMKFTRD